MSTSTSSQESSSIFTPGTWDRRFISRAILAICLVLACMVWAVRFWSVTDRDRAYQAVYAKGVRAYQQSAFDRCSRLLEKTIPIGPRDSTAVLLREKATCLGLAEKYGAQLDALVQARMVAQKRGQDSIAREAAQSIGNVYSYCQRDTVSCEGSSVSMSGTSVSTPILIILIGLALVGTIYLATSRVPEEAT